MFSLLKTSLTAHGMGVKQEFTTSSSCLCTNSYMIPFRTKVIQRNMINPMTNFLSLFLTCTVLKTIPWSYVMKIACVQQCDMLCPVCQYQREWIEPYEAVLPQWSQCTVFVGQYHAKNPGLVQSCWSSKCMVQTQWPVRLHSCDQLPHVTPP